MGTDFSRPFTFLLPHFYVRGTVFPKLPKAAWIDRIGQKLPGSTDTVLDIGAKDCRLRIGIGGEQSGFIPQKPGFHFFNRKTEHMIHCDVVLFRHSVE